MFSTYIVDKITFFELCFFIQGKDLTHGFQPADYKVGIGAGWCAGVEVTENEIICAPPDELPADDISVDVMDREKRDTTERSVLVHIGSNLLQNAGILTYQIPEDDQTLEITLFTLASVSILALAAVAIGKSLSMNLNSDPYLYPSIY